MKEPRNTQIVVRLTGAEVARLERWCSAVRPRMHRSAYVRTRLFSRSLVPGLAARLRAILVDVRDLRERIGGEERERLGAIESTLLALYDEALGPTRER